jgi:hypothetical protein
LRFFWWMGNGTKVPNKKRKTLVLLMVWPHRVLRFASA